MRRSTAVVVTMSEGGVELKQEGIHTKYSTLPCASNRGEALVVGWVGTGVIRLIRTSGLRGAM